jgi:hypothetical protein
MTIDLPGPIADYFALARSDGGAVARCSIDNAVAKDEGRTYDGLAAIRKWKSDASTKYTYTSEPLASEEKYGKTIVTSRMTGNFPASPIYLRFLFNKIASLEIVP